MAYRAQNVGGLSIPHSLTASQLNLPNLQVEVEV
jgi:hypothetical protein